KEKVPLDQQMLSLVPLYTRQLNKIAANKKTRKLGAGAYHKAEKSLVKKVNQLKSMAINTAFMGKNSTGQQAVEMVKKVIDLFKNLSADEIYVAKEKAKSLIAEYLNNYAPVEFHQYPQLKELSSSVINFLDTLLDEELLAEAVKLTAEVCEIVVEKFDWKKLASFDKLPPAEAYKKGYEYGESVMKETFLQASLKANLENKVRSLLINLTNHINRLANEEVNNNNVSTSEEQSITQRFSTPRQLHDSNNNPTENTGTGLSFISP
ncbi:32591_t:CDS:1, partial [Racocetra persica]